jgi:hypothetical protein
MSRAFPIRFLEHDLRLGFKGVVLNEMAFLRAIGYHK